MAVQKKKSMTPKAPKTKAVKAKASKAPKVAKEAKTVSVKERQAQKALFRKFAFDKRRYTPFATEELVQIIGLCNSVIARKKKEELKNLENTRMMIDKKIAELKAKIG